MAYRKVVERRFATGVVKRRGDLGLIGHRDLEGVVVDLFRAVFAELP
jgi:hypothetical protein